MTIIQLRKDTAQNWYNNNTPLRVGEIGIEIDTLKFKIGPVPAVNQNSTPWNSISSYANVVPTDFNNTLNGYLEVGDLSNTVAELVNGNLYIPSTSIIFEGVNPDSYEITLVSPEPTADRIITLPDATTTLVGHDTVQTLTNKTLTSPTLNGIPVAPTASNGTNTTQIATTAFVSNAVSNLINSAPAALDTLNELATALNNDASFSTTITNSIAGKVSKSGGDTIIPSTTSTKGLVVKAITSQSANLQEWQRPDGSVTLSVDSTAVLRGTTADIVNYGQFTSYNYSGSLVGLILQGAASQSANLTEWRNSAGTVLARVASDGAFYAGGLSVYSNGNASLGNTLSSSYIQSVYTLNVATYSSGPVSQVPLTVNGVSGQTGNLTEWKNSSGTVLSKITSAGYMDSAIGLFDSIRASGGSIARMIVSAGNTNNISIPAVNSTYVPLILKGASSQSANLQEWQNNTGNSLLEIDSTGNLNIGAGSNNVWRIKNQTSAVMEWQPGQGFKFYPYGSSNRPLTIQGTVSQTGDLTQWQDNSGNILTKIDPSGNLYFINPTANNNGNDTPSPSINFQGNLWNSAFGNVNMKGAIKVAAYSANANPTISKMSFLLATDNAAPSEVASFTNTGAFSNIGGLDSYGSGVIFRLRNTTTATPDIVIPSPKLELMGRAWNSDQGSTASRAYLQVNANSNNTNPFINRLGFFVATGNNDGGWNYGADATEYMSILGNGRVGINSLAPSATLDIRNISSSNIGLIIKGAASQTADLQQWQNSTGAVYGAMNAYGSMSIINQMQSASASIGNTGVAGASAVVLKVIGVSSQTANLQEWQNSSNTVLASIDSSGSMFTTTASAGTNTTQVATTAFVQTEISSKSDKVVTINAQSTSYTLATSDSDKLVEMSGGGTLTISDSSSFPVGFTCNILQTGSSQVTIAGSGFTPNATPGLKLRAQWSSATLVKRALNSWVVMGDLSA